MHRIALIIVLGAGLAGCDGVPDARRSCAELAEARAAELLDRETAKLEAQEMGTPHQSEIGRKLIRIEAEAYRKQVYEECLRRRGLAPEDR